MAGAREGGTAGFFSGLGKGLLGAVVKPTAGAGAPPRALRAPSLPIGAGTLRCGGVGG